MALRETLELDLSAALRNLAQLDQALDRSTRNFRSGLAAALDPLSGVRIEDVDARAVTVALDSAIEAADLAPEIEADAEPVTVAIDDAVAAADVEIPIEAEVGSIADDIEAAVAAADSTVEVDADTSDAVSAIDELGASAEQAGDGMSVLEGATSRAGAAAGVATGDFSGLEGLLDGAGRTVAGVAAGLTAVAAATGVFFSAALEADTATRAFNRGLGDMADAVTNIQIGGLNDELSDLALRTGNSDEALLLAAARIGELGRSTGATEADVGNLAQNVLALSIRATALNPTLGQAGDVADRLTDAFARGGRALSPYGIALSSAEIEARALADTGKRSAADLTLFDKAVAGSTLAVQRLGTGLAKDINEGAQGAEVRLRSLRERVGELAERLGAPLLEPVLATFEEGQPIIEDVAEGFGELAQVAVPLLIEALRAVQPGIGLTGDLLSALMPVLRLVVDLVEAIPDPVLAAGVGFAGLNRALGGLTSRLAEGGTSARLLSGGIASVTPLTTALAAGLVAVTTVLGENSRKKAEARQAALTLAEALRDETTARRDTLASTIEEDFQRKGLTEALARQGITYRQVADAASSGGATLDKLTAQIIVQARETGGLGDKSFELATTMRELSGRFQESAKAALNDAVAKGELSSATLRAAEAQARNSQGNVNYIDVLNALLPEQARLITGHQEAATAADRQRAADEALEQQIKELTDAVESMIDSQLGADRAALRLRESTADLERAEESLAAAVRDSGAGSDEAAEAQRRLESAQIAQRESALNVARAQVRMKEDTAVANGETVTAEQHQRNLIEAYQAVAATLAPGSSLRVFLEGYIGTLQSVERQVHTDITADGSQAVGEIRRVRNELNAIAGADAGISIGASIGHAAHGAVVGPGEMYIAGDPGPNEELVVGGSVGGRIFSHAETVAMLREALSGQASSTPVAAGSSSTTTNYITVNEVAGDPRATAFAVSARQGQEAER